MFVGFADIVSNALSYLKRTAPKKLGKITQAVIETGKELEANNEHPDDQYAALKRLAKPEVITNEAIPVAFAEDYRPAPIHPLNTQLATNSAEVKNNFIVFINSNKEPILSPDMVQRNPECVLNHNDIAELSYSDRSGRGQPVSLTIDRLDKNTLEAGFNDQFHRISKTSSDQVEKNVFNTLELALELATETRRERREAA